MSFCLELGANELQMAVGNVLAFCSQCPNAYPVLARLLLVVYIYNDFKNNNNNNISMLFFGMIVGGVDIGYQIYRKVTLGPDYNVAISAHIGGLICGMFCLLQLPSLGTTSLHSLSLSPSLPLLYPTKAKYGAYRYREIDATYLTIKTRLLSISMMMMMMMMMSNA